MTKLSHWTQQFIVSPIQSRVSPQRLGSLQFQIGWLAFLSFGSFFLASGLVRISFLLFVVSVLGTPGDERSESKIQIIVSGSLFILLSLFTFSPFLLLFVVGHLAACFDHERIINVWKSWRQGSPQRVDDLKSLAMDFLVFVCSVLGLADVIVTVSRFPKVHRNVEDLKSDTRLLPFVSFLLLISVIQGLGDWSTGLIMALVFLLPPIAWFALTQAYSVFGIDSIIAKDSESVMIDVTQQNNSVCLPLGEIEKWNLMGEKTLDSLNIASRSRFSMLNKIKVDHEQQRKGGDDNEEFLKQCVTASQSTLSTLSFLKCVRLFRNQIDQGVDHMIDCDQVIALFSPNALNLEYCLGEASLLASVVAGTVRVHELTVTGFNTLDCVTIVVSNVTEKDIDVIVPEGRMLAGPEPGQDSLMVVPLAQHFNIPAGREHRVKLQLHAFSANETGLPAISKEFFLTPFVFAHRFEMPSVLGPFSDQIRFWTLSGFYSEVGFQRDDAWETLSKIEQECKRLQNSEKSIGKLHEWSTFLKKTESPMRALRRKVITKVDIAAVDNRQSPIHSSKQLFTDEDQQDDDDGDDGEQAGMTFGASSSSSSFPVTTTPTTPSFKTHIQ